MSPALNDQPAGGPAASRRLRVLVVDDDADTVTTFLSLLRDEGYDARGHASGQSAIDGLKQFDPDVVISDIAMPNVNGWTLAREVRRLMGEQRPLLIAITGQYTKSADKVLAHISGFDFYLTKPADPGVLLALVEKGHKGN